MVNVFKDPVTLLPVLADFIATAAREAIDKHNRFSLVLSGGSSPKKLYELLVSASHRNSIDWKKVFFFFGDERYVHLDHPDSNYLMAKHSLLTPLQIPDAQVFPVNTALSPADAAADYEATIRNYFQDGSCSFDLILLGLGDNSHTASLFPYTAVLHEHNALVKEIFVEEVNMYRITFTAPLINAAQRVAFLVYGEGKADAVRHILEDPMQIEAFPAQLIKPAPGALHWFLDQAAAQGLRGNFN